jgi:hypothetical protein
MTLKLSDTMHDADFVVIDGVEAVTPEGRAAPRRRAPLPGHPRCALSGRCASGV